MTTETIDTKKYNTNPQQTQIHRTVADWQTHRDLSQAEPVIRSMRPYIVGYVRKRRPMVERGLLDPEVLIQEANIGVLIALQRYNWASPFPSYASYWIFAKLYKCAIKSTLVNFGRSANHSKTKSNYGKLQYKFKSENPYLTTYEINQLIAEELDSPLSVIEGYYWERLPMLDINHAQRDTDDGDLKTPLVEKLTDNPEYENDMVKSLDYGRAIEYIRSLMADFKPIERDLLNTRILVNGKRDTFSAIAKRNGVTKQWVEQIEKKLLRTIKNELDLYLNGN